MAWRIVARQLQIVMSFITHGRFTRESHLATLPIRAMRSPPSPLAANCIGEIGNGLGGDPGWAGPNGVSQRRRYRDLCPRRPRPPLDRPFEQPGCGPQQLGSSALDPDPK